MIRISDIRIGTKLGIALGLCVLLNIGMMVSQFINDHRTADALSVAQRQARVRMNSIQVKAYAGGMQIGLRDLRLAATPEQVKAADSYFKARHASLNSFADGMLAIVVNKQNRAMMETVKDDAAKYAAGQAEIMAIKNQVLSLRGKAASLAELPAADQERVLKLNADIDRIAREKTFPLAQNMEKGAEDIVETVERNSKITDEELANIMATAERVQAGLSIVAIVIMIAVVAFAMVSIARPLRALVRPLEELAHGNFTVVVPQTRRGDEVGQISEAMRMMADKVRSTITEVKMSAREVTNASAEISTSTTDLSQRTEEQAASLEETSASMEQISATVKKNAENAQQANASAAQTREVADRGGAVVAQAVSAMAKIEESSRKISDIITVIDEIARQTNLLALNAAVEAARAGEAGRGFAVVASEVRSLAQRSSQAAKDIKDLITNSNSQVKDGVDLVNQAGTALNEIVESIKQVAAIVGDIANASIEQSTGIEQVNRALNQMDEVTQQNSALVEENAATAKTLEHQAKSMDEQVAFFQIETGETIHRSVTAKPVVAKAAPAKADAKAESEAAETKEQPQAAPKIAAKAAPTPAPKRAAAPRTQGALALKEDTEWKEF